MRYAKRNLRIVGIGTAVLLEGAVISLSSHIKSLRPVIEAEEQNGSALEAVLGNDILPNTAYDWGSVYTLNDGTDIAQKYVNEESGFTVYGGAEGYQVLGSDTGGGLVQGMGNILLSSVAKANRLARTGDSIVTTLHSSAMAAANEALAEYGGDVQAGICVVLRDGAVLVDAGNNVLSSPADVYLGISEQTDSFVNYNASAMAKGSVFKAITARTLLEYDGDLPEDYSLYNDSFEDLSAITLNNGNIIQNWDYNIAGDYGSDLGNGQYSRLVSLSDALQFSSNTYFVRHALQLPDCYDKLRSLFGLDKSLTTEINSLDGIETADERQPYLYFGQDAYLSSIRLCQLYNYAFSGEFYVPFYIASVIQPDGEKIYTADPQPKEAYRMDITPEDDILAGGLADCFDAYTNGKYTALSGSGRILCKSGTAELDDENGRENRTMMMTILSEDRTQVLASCCMIVCSAPKDSVYNNVMIEKLLQVASAAGIL